jgi:hypothetical protein
MTAEERSRRSASPSQLAYRAALTKQMHEQDDRKIHDRSMRLQDEEKVFSPTLSKRLYLTCCSTLKMI